MEQEKILLEIFDTLKNKGFDHPVLDKTTWWKNRDNRNESIEESYHYAIIFDHKFAKFIWGDKAYKSHLSKMAESDDYLLYIQREYLNTLS